MNEPRLSNRAGLEAVVVELKRLRRAGTDAVYLGDETFRRIKALAAGAASGAADGGDPEPAPPARAPEPEGGSGSGAGSIPEPPNLDLPEGSKEERWNWLRERVLNCPVCTAHARVEQGKKVVFGVGNLDADILFCGEAPGADEEEQGEPFVGRAGQLLTKIIEAMGLARREVYIGNIMNWRPEMPNRASGNRPPTSEEMRFCLPYLIAQVAIVQPKVIVALGNTAVSGLLGHDPSRRMGAIRGTWLSFQGIPLLPTYHPSYLLRYANNRTKRQVWEDMLAVMDKVGLPISEKQRGFFR